MKRSSHLGKLPEKPDCWTVGQSAWNYAKSFARFGSDVTVVEMDPTIVTKEDEEVSATLEGRYHLQEQRHNIT